MTSMTLKSAIWMTLIASAVAFSAPPPGKGPGGGETTLTNNLSVPAIMVGGGGFTGVSCGTNPNWSTLIAPIGDPLNGYTVDDGYYYVQGVHKWQAQCTDYANPNDVPDVRAEWGDNMTGDAKLKVGSPIRVELLLSDTSGSLYQGYVVKKLEPEKLDRESAYGTQADVVTADEGTTFSPIPASLAPIVYDGEASMTITGPEGFEPIFEDPVGAEINATGKIVYGYNLRVSAAGQYVITFEVPNVNITSVDAGSSTPTTVTLPITVIGGGGKRPPR